MFIWRFLQIFNCNFILNSLFFALSFNSAVLCVYSITPCFISSFINLSFIWYSFSRGSNAVKCDYFHEFFISGFLSFNSSFQFQCTKCEHDLVDTVGMHWKFVHFPLVLNLETIKCITIFQLFLCERHDNAICHFTHPKLCNQIYCYYWHDKILVILNKTKYWKHEHKYQMVLDQDFHILNSWNWHIFILYHASEGLMNDGISGLVWRRWMDEWLLGWRTQQHLPWWCYWWGETFMHFISLLCQINNCQ